MEQKIAYEPHPVAPERKAELRTQGYKIIDARFAPEGRERQDAQGGEDDKLSVADIRAKLAELGVGFDPKTKKADLLALLDAAAQGGEDDK